MTSPKERKAILAEMAVTLGRPPTPDDIVAAASSPTHKFHGDFVWNDAAAAHQHRLDQARSIIRSVEILVSVGKTVIKSVAYVRDPSVGRVQGYIQLDAVQKRSAEASAILQAEVQRIRAIVERARGVASVLGLQYELQVLLEQIITVERKVAAKMQRKRRSGPTK